MRTGKTASRQGHRALPPRTKRSGIYKRLDRLQMPRLSRSARRVLRYVQIPRAVRNATDQGSVRPVWVGKQWLAGKVMTGVIPANVAGDTYARLREILEAHEIVHFVISDSPYRSFEVAIPEESWSKLEEAFSVVESDELFYVEGSARTRRGRPSTSIALAGSSYAAQMIAASKQLRCFPLIVESANRKTYGYRTACKLTKWSTVGDKLVSLQPNSTAEYITEAYARTTIDVTNPCGVVERRLSSTRARSMSRVSFPIDLVYMWVDGSDPQWRRRLDRRKLEDASALFESMADTVGDLVEGSLGDVNEASAPWRFRDRNEFLYSLRSVEMYAPWVRSVHVVTDHQVPRWLNLDHPKIRVHFHDEIFSDPSALPVFNSHAIGTQLHHIDGLSEHYLYLNDDFLFGGVVEPEHFFTPSGLARVRRSRTSLPIADRSVFSEIECARQNAADLMEQRHGVRPTSLFGHVPYPQMRSVAYELERTFSVQFDRTMRSPFRSHTDIEPNSWMIMNELELTGRAVESHATYGYFLLGDKRSRRRLYESLHGRRHQLMCLNDSGSTDGHDYSGWLERQLKWAYPTPSAFELPPDAWRATVAATVLEGRQ